jgi:hypothetical protein
VLTSRIGKLLIPLLLLAAAGFAIANFSVLTEQWQSLLSNTLPIISLTIGLFLCIQRVKGTEGFIFDQSKSKEDGGIYFLSIGA